MAAMKNAPEIVLVVLAVVIVGAGAYGTLKFRAECKEAGGVPQRFSVCLKAGAVIEVPRK